MHKLLRDFEKTRLRDNQQKKKRTCRIMDFAVPADHRGKMKESKQRDKNVYLAREQKQTMEHEGDSLSICGWCTWDNTQGISKGTRRLGNKRTSRDHPDYSIIKIGQNTEKSPGDSRRHRVIQTPVTNHQLTLL